MACLILAAVNGVAAEEPLSPPASPPSGPSIGLSLGADGVDALPTPIGEGAGRAFPVRLVARWSDVETARGSYDWTATERSVARIVASGFEPVLCLTGSNALYAAGDGSPLEGGSLDAWTAFVRSAWDAFEGRVATYQIWDAPDGGAAAVDPEIYAFFLKSSALALRAEARAAALDVRIAQGDVDPSRLDWQRTLWDADVAPYIDVLPVRLSTTGASAPGDALAAIFAQAVQHPPAPELWAYIESGAAGDTSSLSPAAVEAVSSSATVALVPVAGDDASGRRAEWALGLHTVLAEGFAPAPRGNARFEDDAGRTLPGARIVGRFLSDEEFVDLVVFDLGTTTMGAEDRASLVVEGNDVRDVRFVDPRVARRPRTASSQRPEGRAIRIPYRPYPAAVTFRRPTSAPGFALAPEELEVARRRGMTAEEIIARYQEVQKEQDDRLERLMARGRVVFHYRLTQGGAGVDVAIESNYFWERDGELEWEQTDYYINGNRARWKKFPKLPLIQPEKVMTVPLDLTLDKTYTYALRGEGDVDGRPAYILSFEPTAPDAAASLYRGKIWIDRETFVRLRTNLIQTQLEAPVLSNEENDLYAPVEGPDGETYWLMKDVTGQQLWTVTGRSFVVQRELTFTSFQINPDPEVFEARRRDAYASKNQMLRDTKDGFRYLERQDDGSRIAKETIDTSQLFVAAGVFKDNSIDNVLPLAGVNYFNYDLWGKNLQTNVFFAGAFTFANITDPDVFSGKADAAAEAALSLFKGNDKVFLGDDEVLVERIETRDQNFSGRVGFPLGDFTKLNLIAGLRVASYFEDKDAKKEREANGLDYVLPPDHTTLSGTLQLTYNRKGYSTQAQATWARRSEWGLWGLKDGGTGQILNPDYDPSQRNFTRFRIGVAKEWFLPKFQKIRGNATYLDGRDMDRFSRYQFSFFGGTRLSGFAGSGVRFDRGAIVRAGYAFNVFDVIQFNATMERAHVEEFDSPVGSQDFTGVGLSGNFVGPWKTVFALSYGYALGADIAEIEGQQEFLITVFKLF